jgi:hypothetical protein
MIVKKIARRTGILAVAALSLGALVGGLVSNSPALAHEGECSFCSMPIIQNTAKQDNEVVLKAGSKHSDYRCVYCALSEAHSDIKGDLSIVAPAEAKGKIVTISRKAGKWTTTPASAVFVGAKVSHRYCQTGYRAVTSRKAFDTYVKQNKKIVGDAKPLTLAQMIALTK